MLASLHVKLADIMLTSYVVPVQQTATKEDLKLPGLVLFHHILASAYLSLWTVAQANGIVTDTISCRG
jgi:hypothetical protein